MQTHLSHLWFSTAAHILPKRLLFRAHGLIYSFLKRMFNNMNPPKEPFSHPTFIHANHACDGAKTPRRAAMRFAISCPQSLYGCLLPECPGDRHLTEGSAEMNLVLFFALLLQWRPWSQKAQFETLSGFELPLQYFVRNGPASRNL